MVAFFLTTYLVCPNNFPGRSKPPQVNDTVVLCFRDSDTAPKAAIALTQGEKFLGWVRRADTQRLAPLVEVVGERGYRLEATVTTMESYHWSEGGGICREGFFAIGLCREGDDGDVVMS